MTLVKILKYINNDDIKNFSSLYELNITHYVIEINKTNVFLLRQLYYYKCMIRTAKIICDISYVRDIKEIVQFCVEYGMDGILTKKLEEKSDKDFVHNFCNVLNNLPHPYAYINWEIILEDLNDFELFDNDNENDNVEIIKKNVYNSFNRCICIEWSTNVKNIVDKYKFDVEGNKVNILCNKMNNIDYPLSKFISSIKDDILYDEIFSIINQYL